MKKRKYRVYIADAFTMIPLLRIDVVARSKGHAKRIAKKALHLDNTYFVCATRLEV